MILSEYIDYDKAVEEVLKDKKNKLIALEQMYLRLKEVEEAQEGVFSIDTSRQKVKGGLKSDRAVNLIIEKQNILEKIKDLEYFRDSFNSAWKKLKKEEQILLNEFYIDKKGERQRSIDDLCSEFNCEVATIYRMKQRAVKKFKSLIAG